MQRRKLQPALFLCVLALSVSGCRRRTVQAAPPVIIQPAEQPQPAAAQPEPAPPPETTTAPAPAPTPIEPAPKAAPKKAVVPAAPKDTPETPAPKPAAPQMTPQLSPEEQAAFERKTNESIAATEKNLQQVYGRDLSAAQHDLVEKIRSFLGEAREAGRNADWLRARNLAEKAYLLSVELTKSL